MPVTSNDNTGVDLSKLGFTEVQTHDDDLSKFGFTEIKKKVGGSNLSVGGNGQLKTSSPTPSQSPLPSVNNTQQQPSFFMPSHNDLAQGQIAPSESTVAVAPQQSLQAQNNKENIPIWNKEKADYQQKVIKNTPTAIKNAAIKSLKIQGINPNNAAQLNNEMQKFQSQVEDGNATVGFDKEGTPGLIENPGLFSSFHTHMMDAINENKESREFKDMNLNDRVKFANQKLQQSSAYIGEKPTPLGSVGAMLGGATPTLGLYGAGALSGTALEMAAPETGGLSNLAVKPVMSFVMNAGSEANKSGMNGVLGRYAQIKKTNPQIDDATAMKQAENGEDVDRLAGIGQAALFSKTGSELGKSVTNNFIKGTIHSGLDIGAKTAAVEGGKDIAHNIEGVTNKSASDIATDMGNAFAQNAPTGSLLHAFMGGITGAFKLPALIKSGLKYDITTKMKPDEVNAALQKNVQSGAITPEQAQQATNDLGEYSDVLNTVPKSLPDNVKASVTGLIEKRNNISKQSEKLDQSAQDLVKPQIDAINNQIKEIYRTGKPLQSEINPATGETYEKPTYDDVAKQKVQDLADNISKGKRITEPEDLQAQANFPNELENELNKIKKSETPKEDETQSDAYKNVNKYLKANEKENEVPVPETKASPTDKGVSEVSQPTEEKPIAGQNYIEPEKVNVKPNGDNIQVDQNLQTLGFGKFAGKPENEENKKITDGQIRQGNVPIGDSGETFDNFIDRTIKTIQPIIEKDPENTVVSTHSANVKAIQTWDDMGRPDIKDIQSGGDLHDEFVDKYLNAETKEGNVYPLTTDGKTILLNRHGETEDNVQQENGTSNFRKPTAQLTDHGKDQAEEAGQKIKEITGGEIPKIYRSPLDRSGETTNIINNVLNGKEEPQSEEPVSDKGQEQQPTIKEVEQKKSNEEPTQIESESKEGNEKVIKTIKQPVSSDSEPESEVEENIESQNKNKENAIQKQSAGSIFQHPQETTGEKGSERSGMESGIEGHVPPTEGKTKSETSGEEKVTGVKKAITEPLRTELGLPKVDIPKMTNDDIALNEAKQRVDSGISNPRDLVDRILTKNEGYKNEDDVMDMQYYAHQLEAKSKQLAQEKKDASTPEEKAEVSGKLQQLSDETDNQTKAAKIAGNQWMRIGNRMQIVVDAGFNPSRERIYIEDAYNGEIPKDVNGKFEAIRKERDDAIAEKLAIEEKLKQRAAKQGVEKIKNQAEKTAKRDETKEKLKAEEKQLLEEIRKSIKKDFGSLNAGIPFPKETIETLGKLAVNYFKQGALSVEALVDKMYNALKDDIEGIDKKQIREIIANYEPLTIERETSKLNKKANALEDKITPSTIITKKGEIAGVSEPTDFTVKSKQKSQFRNNTEWVKAQQRVANAEYKIKVLKRQAFESKKNFYQKGLMWAARMFRLSILSGTNVLYKLSSAATIGGAGMRIPSEAIGGMWSGIFKSISEKAPIEGGLNATAEVKFMKDFLNPKKFAQNSWEILKSGQSNLSKRLGGGAQYEHVPILYIPTDLHQIIKDPVKRAVFEASMQKSINWAEKKGLDINDNLVYQSLENAAYKRANYEIFQESNALSRKFQEMKSQLDKGGNVGATGKFLVDFMIPVSTVPTNIVRRLISTSPLGLGRGFLLARDAYAKGIEKLTPEDADRVMRQLKQGSIGTALYLTGWLAASHFGGLYSKFNPNKKRQEGELTSDQMEVNGQMIPKPVQHALPFEIMQMAATTRHVYDNYIDRKQASKPEAIYNAGLSSIGALLEQVPVVETGVHAVEATSDPYEAKKLKEDASRRFEPQILRETGVIPKETKTSGAATTGFPHLKQSLPHLKKLK